MAGPRKWLEINQNKNASAIQFGQSESNTLLGPTGCVSVVCAEVGSSNGANELSVDCF